MSELEYQSTHLGERLDGAIDTIQTGASDPTQSTVGLLGQIYRNTTTGKHFRCIKIDGIVYTWIDVDQFSSYTISSTAPTFGWWFEEVAP